MERVNVGGTANVVQAAQECGVRKIVYMSSVAAIGASFTPQLLNEDSPYVLGSLNLGYFETKRKAEEIIKTAVQADRVDAVMVNPSTVYGPADAKKGSRKVQVKVAQGRFPFYPSGGASIVSIHDVIDGLLMAWRKGRKGERYILSGENLLVRDLFKKIATRAGVKPPKIYLPRLVALGLGSIGDRMEKHGRKGPINSESAWVSSLFHWFDNTKAQNELGFNPRPADVAINESVDWMKANGLL
jgi:dihydroflavonol-4-reductase